MSRPMITTPMSNTDTTISSFTQLNAPTVTFRVETVPLSRVPFTLRQNVPIRPGPGVPVMVED